MLRLMFVSLVAVFLLPTPSAKGAAKIDSEAAAITAARPVAEKALTRAYAKFEANLRKSAPGVAPAKHDGSWTEPVDPPTVVQTKDGFEVHWAHLAPAGWDYEVRVSVSATGKIKVLAAQAAWANA